MHFKQNPKSKRSVFTSRVFLDSLKQINKQEVQEDSILEPSIVGLKDIDSIRQNFDDKKWKGNAFRVLFYVSQFIRQLKTNAIKFKYKLLTHRILDIINDQASDPKFILNQGKRRYFNLYENLFQYCPIIEPDSSLKITWDILILIAVLLSLFYVPIQLSFNFDEPLLIYIAFDFLPAWLLLIDIFINCLTAYYKQGVIHRDDIIKHYAQSTLIVDLIIVIPALLATLGIQQVRFFLLLRVFRVSRMVESIEELINLKESYANIFQLIKLGFFIILVCHFCACIWAYLGIYQLQQGYHCWLIEYNLENSTFIGVYVTSLYFSVITTLTIGYGDISPTTDIEKIYVVSVALLVCGVLAYSISTIGNIFKQMSEKQDLFKTKMKILIRYMRARRLSPQIQLQVKKFYEHFASQESDSHSQAEEMMQSLSKNLKEKIAYENYFQILKKSRLISNLCDNCIKQLCLQVREAKCVPDDIIYTRKEQVSKLIFVIQGELCLMSNDQIISTYKEGCVAERQFILQTTFPSTLQSSIFCQIAYLSYEDFYNTIKAHQEDFEKIHMIKENLIHNEAYQNFGQVCEICKWTHQIFKCPYVFVSINKNKLMSQIKQNLNQERVKYYRKRLRLSSRKTLNDLKEFALALIINDGLVPQQDLTDQYLKSLGFQVDNLFDKLSYQKIETTHPVTTITKQEDSGAVNQFINRTSSITRQRRRISELDIQQKTSLVKLNQSPHILRSPTITESSISSEESQPRGVCFNKDGQVLLPLQMKRNSSTVGQDKDSINYKEQLNQNNLTSQKDPTNSQINTITQLNMESINNLNAEQGKRLSFIRNGARQNAKKLELDINMIQELEQEQKLQENEIISFNIDKQQNMIVYFPNNNYEIVIKRISSRRNQAFQRNSYLMSFQQIKYAQNLQ
ncbi:hypothetical protein pb186bvf_000966 [Paramecium bursaria]